MPKHPIGPYIGWPGPHSLTYGLAGTDRAARRASVPVTSPRAGVARALGARLPTTDGAARVSLLSDPDLLQRPLMTSPRGVRIERPRQTSSSAYLADLWPQSGGEGAGKGHDILRGRAPGLEVRSTSTDHAGAHRSSYRERAYHATWQDSLRHHGRKVVCARPQRCRACQARESR
jgi:hypothetical protein